MTPSSDAHSDPDAAPPLDARRTMRYWLAYTLREARERAGEQPKTVAQLAGVDISTISRFERYETWPQKIDRVVAAYAMLSGIEDGRDLWARAIERYRANGGAPILGELSLAQRSLLLALEAAQRQQPYDGGSPAAPTATHRPGIDGESSRPMRRQSR